MSLLSLDKILTFMLVDNRAVVGKTSSQFGSSSSSSSFCGDANNEMGVNGASGLMPVLEELIVVCVPVVPSASL